MSMTSLFLPIVVAVVIVVSIGSWRRRNAEPAMASGARLALIAAALAVALLGLWLSMRHGY
jgi:hypothetical protein